MCGLYILNGSTVIGHESVASQDLLDKFKLSHLRLGHVSERDLVELAKHDLMWSKKLNKLEWEL